MTFKQNAALFLLVSSLGTAAPALVHGESLSPLIHGFGNTVAVSDARERPDPNVDYKVVINVTKAGEGGSPPPELDRAARLANLLAANGIPADHRHIVVIISGTATASILTDEATAARGKGSNASADLMLQLVTAGVRVDVCGQALAHNNIARKEVLPEVQVDLAGVTTLTTLQLKGYALLSD